MFKADIENINFILEKIEDLESYVIKYDKVSSMLEDNIGRDASLMCLLQIGETINKLKNSYEELTQDEIKGAYDVRNFIAHDYMGVDLGLIEFIIRSKIPKLKTNLFNLIKK
jgi:uncharacterized protein with HEPN domain